MKTKMSSAKSCVNKAVAKKSCKTTSRACDVHDPLPQAHQACSHCKSLPVGSVELVSLLLVLVFTLSAVLITSVYALHIQGEKLNALEYQVAMQEAQAQVQ